MKQDFFMHTSKKDNIQSEQCQMIPIPSWHVKCHVCFYMLIKVIGWGELTELSKYTLNKSSLLWSSITKITNPIISKWAKLVLKVKVLQRTLVTIIIERSKGLQITDFEGKESTTNQKLKLYANEGREEPNRCQK